MMKKLHKRSVLFLIFAVTVFAASQVLLPSVTYGQDPNTIVTPPPQQEQDRKTSAEIVAYWTPERMEAAEANPYPMPLLDASEGQPSTEFSLEQSAGVPGLVSGQPPVQMQNGDLTAGETWEGTEPQWGGPPGNWSTSYPGPFQRWTWYGRYTTYPTSTIGKLFFSQSGSNYVCSASVVYAGAGQRDVIATAGHCLSSGTGIWSTNLYFCPSYNAGGENPTQGCWPQTSGAAYASTFTGWHTGGNAEYDVGCMIGANTGTVNSTNVGNVTGVLGRAWNYGYQQPEYSFGYPSASPFPGYHIIAVAGPGWYTYSWGAAADSKYMGNDMTGGSSGGPWILGLGHNSAEYPDTDGSGATDPPGASGGGYLNGVNSHKIVVGGVTRTQEMGSPQFTNSNPNTETLWSSCQGYANSMP